jgi:ferredoxin
MAQASFLIEVRNIDERFLCQEHQSLLGGIESQRSQAVQIGCRGGGCGVCKIRIISGDYETKKVSVKHVSKEQAAEGYALSCRVFPCSDMIIETVAIQILDR